MLDFFDLYNAAENLGITPRTFERHVDRINRTEGETPIMKIKRPGERKFYYSAKDVERVRAHIDSRFGPVQRPGDNSPKTKAVVSPDKAAA